MKVLGLVNTYSNADFGPMSEHRMIASTQFLGRYSFIDFPLSNFTNSNINYLGVLCSRHIRSLTTNVGNGRAWIRNTKIGDFNILYDEPTMSNPGYHTDVSCLLENQQFIHSVNPDYVIIAPSHIIYQADFSALLKAHVDSGNRISVLYSHERDLRHSFIGARKLVVSDQGKILHSSINQGDEDEGDVSLSTYIMDYPMLVQLAGYAEGASSFFSLADALSYMNPVFARGVRINSYVRCFDSLSHYLQYSLELLDHSKFRALFRHGWTIFTKSFDTPPVLYKAGCQVKNSYIANGSIIEGTVENSILGRGVRIKPGAVIKNTVIGSNAYIDEGTLIENAVVDKEAQVLHIAEVHGSLNDPMYIARGDLV